jgi:hypothetical protein
MSLMLGLSVLNGVAIVAFAQSDTNKEKPGKNKNKNKNKKKGKKGTDSTDKKAE